MRPNTVKVLEREETDHARRPREPDGQAERAVSGARILTTASPTRLRRPARPPFPELAIHTGDGDRVNSGRLAVRLFVHRPAVARRPIVRGGADQVDR